jgi:hypothetical protein
MSAVSGRLRLALAGTAIAIALAFAASSATAATSFKRTDGFDAPQTPAAFDRVGVLKVGPK